MSYCAIIVKRGSQFGFNVLFIRKDLQFCRNEIVRQLRQFGFAGDIGIVYDEQGEIVWQIRHDEAVKL